MPDIERIKAEREKAIKQLDERAIKCLDELDLINKEYVNWDEFEKSEIINKARNSLANGFEKEILEMELKES